MPPRTGDAQLTMSQRVPLAGCYRINPSGYALLDARKGLNMFKKVNVPVLGIVENMSTFICPKCGEPTDIFGTGGAEQEALRLGVDFLGGIPLHKDIRTTSDDGTPIVESDSIHSKSLRDIASAIWENVDKQRKAPPVIKAFNKIFAIRFNKPLNPFQLHVTISKRVILCTKSVWQPHAIHPFYIQEKMCRHLDASQLQFYKFFLQLG